VKSALINILLLIGSVFVSLFLVEVAAQIYVYKIAEKGKLFEPDKITGWRVIPNLNIKRKNANGDIWTVTTDEEGLRTISNSASYSGTKVLILGDSFAFGQGVDIEDRFDAVINNHGYYVINTGVMGYGTDQQFLKAKPYLALLKNNDVVIVLTSYNDFFDITRKKHSGRAKPRYTIENGVLKLHKPQITLNEILRDKSYIYSKLASFVAVHNEVSTTDILHASNIYQELIEDLAKQLASKEIRIIVAYHGILNIKENEQRNIITETINAICNNRDIECLNIDEQINIANNRQYFLDDGHWNNKGHGIVGALIFNKITGIVLH
jgi:lysophospholipase L1-like esterase